MPRFYCPEPLEIGLQLKLPESITRHIQVLRLTVPDSITLFNGQGGEFSASLIEITKNLAVVEIKAFFARECELNHSLTLAQGLPEANKIMVGPEGGFSETEEELALKRGAICVSMGSRVLRTETAGLAALAAIQSLWGEM